VKSIHFVLTQKPFDFAQDKPSQKVKTDFKFLEIYIPF